MKYRSLDINLNFNINPYDFLFNILKIKRIMEHTVFYTDWDDNENIKYNIDFIRNIFYDVINNIPDHNIVINVMKLRVNNAKFQNRPYRFLYAGHKLYYVYKILEIISQTQISYDEKSMVYETMLKIQCLDDIEDKQIFLSIENIDLNIATSKSNHNIYIISGTMDEYLAPKLSKYLPHGNKVGYDFEIGRINDTIVCINITTTSKYLKTLNKIKEKYKNYLLSKTNIIKHFNVEVYGIVIPEKVQKEK